MTKHLALWIQPGILDLREVEAGDSAQSHPCLHSRFKASLDIYSEFENTQGYRARPCLREVENRPIVLSLDGWGQQQQVQSFPLTIE